MSKLNQIQKDFSALCKERDKLYVSKDNPKRLKEIIELLDYIFFGIKM